MASMEYPSPPTSLSGDSPGRGRPKKRSRSEALSDDESIFEFPDASFIRIKQKRLESGDIQGSNGNDGFLTLSENCHEIERTNYHFPDFQSSIKQIDKACRARWNTRKQQYRHVHVLHLYWEDDDLGVTAEIDELDRIFSVNYRFHSQKYAIPSSKRRTRDTVNVVQAFVDVQDADGTSVDAEGTLFILYYGGHAYQNDKSQPIWLSKKRGGVALEPASFMPILKELDADVLLLFDSCEALPESFESNGKGVAVAITATGFEPFLPGIAPEVGRDSFTHALIEVLGIESVSPSVHLTDVSLHTLLVSHLRKTNKALSRDELGGLQRGLGGEVIIEPYTRRCPVHHFLSKGKESRTIGLSPLPLAPEVPIYQSVHSTAGQGICVPPEKPVVPEVLISVRLTPDSLDRIDVDDWAQWLLSMPGYGYDINVEGREVPIIEGIYQSHSTLLLVRMPLEIWNLLPKDKSMSFIGYIYGENRASKFNLDVRARIAALQQADRKDSSSLDTRHPAFMDRAAKGFSALDTEIQHKITMSQPPHIQHGQQGSTQPPKVQTTVEREESKLRFSLVPQQFGSPSIENHTVGPKFYPSPEDDDSSLSGLSFANMGPPQPNVYENLSDVTPDQRIDSILVDYEENLDDWFSQQPSSILAEHEENLDNGFSLQPPSSFGFGGLDTSAPVYFAQPQAETIIIVGRAAPPQSAVKVEIEATYQHPNPSRGHGLEPADDSEDDSQEARAAALMPPKKKKKNEDNGGDFDAKPLGKKPRLGAAHPAESSSRSEPGRRIMTLKQPDPSYSSEHGGSSTAQKLKGVALNTPVPPVSKSTPLFPCTQCKQNHFKDQLSLDNHIKKQHTHPYHCVFHFSGCTSTFTSKNEWKRHVSSQHLLLNYWLCQEAEWPNCINHSSVGPSTSPSGSRSRSRGAYTASSTVAGAAGPSFGPPLPIGAIFNRKDLYTQHLRRLHTPPNIKKPRQGRKGAGPNSSLADWEAYLTRLADRAVRDRCALPTFMRCLAQHCDQDFHGLDAWDQRMEHVGRHLERAATGLNEEPPVQLGTAHDPTLIEWASRPDVAVIRRNAATGQLELNNPFKPPAKIPAAVGSILNDFSNGLGYSERFDRGDQDVERLVWSVKLPQSQHLVQRGSAFGLAKKLRKLLKDAQVWIEGSSGHVSYVPMSDLGSIISEPNIRLRQDEDVTYHLIFPWAEGSVRSLWKGNPSVDQRGPAPMLWMARELSAIGDALSFLHVEYADKLGPGEKEKYGRHGDIKAENFLVYNDDPASFITGRIFMADFGLAKWHRQESRSKVHEKATSPSYRPPEFDHGSLSWKSDIWSLGAFFLEFVTWYLKGWEAVEEDFPNFREEKDIFNNVESSDIFFTLDDRYRPVVKHQVVTWAKELRQHPGCTLYLHELLSLVMEEMLVADKDKRIEAPVLRDTLKSMYELCQSDPGKYTRTSPLSNNSA